MRREVFVWALLAACSMGGCSLVLETLPYRTVTPDANGGDTLDATRFDASDAGAPDRVDLDAGDRDVSAVDAPAIDVPAIDVPTIDIPAIDTRPIDAPSIDRPVVETGRIDARPEATTIDTSPPVDIGPEISTADVRSDVSGLVPCISDTDCVPYFCGCSACTISEVTCAGPTTTCPLLCPSVPCNYLGAVSCGCAGGFCQVQRRGGDAGVDAVCTNDLACSPGLLCCGGVCSTVDPIIGCP